jgi:uncharacterized protein (DUF2236 family)
MQLVRLLPPLDPGKPGDGGVVPDGSIVRNVAAKRAVTLGGLPAVLLQLAHPMVAQGVSDYSDFERDPLARMISTLDATLVMTFGDHEQAGEKVAKVRLTHQSVHGELTQTHGEWRRGERYSALNAELCLWVYATGVELVLDTYSALCSPLSPTARAEYYEGGKPLAELMGVKRSILPATYPQFRSYYQDMLGRLVVGPMARDIAAAIFAARLGPVPVSPLGPGMPLPCCRARGCARHIAFGGAGGSRPCGRPSGWPQVRWPGWRRHWSASGLMPVWRGSEAPHRRQKLRPHWGGGIQRQ